MFSGIKKRFFGGREESGIHPLSRDTSPSEIPVPEAPHDAGQEKRVESTPTPSSTDVQEERATHEDVLLALVDIEGDAKFALCVVELKDRNLSFSTIDGVDLSTPEARLKHIERLKNLDSLDRSWYEKKQSFIQTAKAEGRYLDHKEFGSNFVSEIAIPEFLNQNVPIESVIKRCQWWQMAGTDEQWALKEFLQMDEFGRTTERTVRNVDQAGCYRDGMAGIDMYIAPPHENVPVLMDMMIQQMNNFSEQLFERQKTVSPEEYQDMAIELAAYAKHNMIQIHPMGDGNGRTSRALYEYFVVKHLGPDNPYRHIPLQGEHEDIYIGGAHGNAIQIETYLESDPKDFTDPTIGIQFPAKPGMRDPRLIRRLKETDIDAAVFQNRPQEAWFPSIRPNDSRWSSLVKSIKKAIENGPHS